uniref:Uncharacterized protein n=1 Tax=Strigamia maritima TaxID=126957 RepID=T1J7S7_STRMM
MASSFSTKGRFQLFFYLPTHHFPADQCVLNPNYVRSIQEFQWTSVPLPAGSASPPPPSTGPRTSSCRTDCLWPARCGSPAWPAPRTELVRDHKSSSNSPACESALTSPLSSAGPICRICHEGDTKEELVAPCRCAGTMGLVHQTCIEKWLSSSNSNSCEICKYVFITCKQPRPYIHWLQDPSNPSDLRNLAADLLCFTLLTPLAAVSMYLCCVGARHYNAYRLRWEASALICLALFLVVIYGIWSYVTVRKQNAMAIRYHLNVIREWRKTHNSVQLLQMRRAPSSLYMMRHLATASNNNSNSGEWSSPSFSSFASPSHTLEMTHLPTNPPMKRANNSSERLETTHITANVTLHTIIRANHLPETTV